MASKKKEKPSGYRAVPLSPRTGKPLKRVRRGQKIIVGLKGPRGGIKKLASDTQKYYKTDFQNLNEIISKSKGGNFVVQEQKTRFVKREKGRPVYRTDAKGKKRKVYQTKLTARKPRSFTKPILYSKGTRTRALDLAFKKGNYINQKIIRNLTVIKPNSPVHTQTLTGRTLKEAISNLHVDINMSQIKKRGFGLYYNIMMVITTPDGERIKVPVSGEFVDNEFEGTNTIGGQLFGRSEVTILANLHSKMARSMRYALKNTGSGYAFTSLATLQQIENREWKKVKQAEAAGEIEKANRLTGGISGLYFGPGNKNYFFKDPKTRLTHLKPDYMVTLHVKYELIY